MNAATFHETLMATARVACCAALVSGCAPRYGEVSDSSVADSDATDTSDGDSGESSDTALAECEDRLSQTGAFVLPGEEVEDCCTLVAEHYDSVNLEGLESWDQREQCCELLDWSGTLACTPWGPPTPPAMRALAVA